jgi:hypothetical protein
MKTLDLINSFIVRSALSIAFATTLALGTGCAAQTAGEDVGDNGGVASGEDELRGGGPLADGSCDKQNLLVCRSYGGGDACFAKYGCKPGDEKSGSSSTRDPAGVSAGAEFSTYYLDNYSTIDRERRKFWNQPFGCAATASTALKLGGFKVKQVLLTNDVESQLIKLGWTKITNLKALQAGDVVFASKSGSNVEGTYAHVFVFHTYTNSAKTYAKISDNNGGNISRNIGPGPKTESEVAFRAPK